MIIHLKKNLSPSEISSMADELDGFHLHIEDRDILVTSSNLKQLDSHLQDKAEEVFVFDNDIQLASKGYNEKKKPIRIGDIELGGNSGNTLLMAGPCSVESEDQINSSASFLKDMGVRVLRAGSFKPRTSPYSFQGLGKEGLALLGKVRECYGLKIITEIKDASHADEVIAFADIIQVGAKAMYDHAILSKCSKTRKPVLLKRGFGTTLQEFVQAGEFILSGGNENLILCERGIRTFEDKTRFTLDLCGVAYLKEYTNLPVVVDPSHAMGYAYGVPDLCRASMAMGIDGLLIEVHPDPKNAKSDKAQQIDHPEFKKLFPDLREIAKVIGRKLI